MASAPSGASVLPAHGYPFLSFLPEVEGAEVEAEVIFLVQPEPEEAEVGAIF